MGVLHKLYNPQIYQGNPKKKNYFEGWYYKVVSKDETQVLAFIPGISIGRSEPDHAFIQVLDGVRGESTYFDFPPESFQADDKTLQIKIGDNLFTDEGMEVNLPSIKGKLSFGNRVPIKTSLFSPGIMGWYSFVPFMQCYHGIISMDHSLKGWLDLKDSRTSFEGGKGYVEKDWGTSFPKCWIWTQCNNFNNESPVSVMASVAHIPWMGNYFVGFLVSLYIDHELHVFATYNGSKMKVDVDGGGAQLQFKKGKRELHLSCTPGPGADLRSPIEGDMKGKVNESIQSGMHLRYLYDGKILHNLQGTSAGLEIAGDISVLLSTRWKNK